MNEWNRTKHVKFFILITRYVAPRKDRVNRCFLSSVSAILLLPDLTGRGLESQDRYSKRTGENPSWSWVGVWKP